MPEGLVKVAEIPGRGRALVATRAIKAGEILLADAPLLLYPATPTATASYCSHCYRVLPSTPLHCPSCRAALFCSPRCLSSSSSHSRSPWLCRALSSLPPLDADLLSQARFLVHAYNLGADDFLRLLSLQGSPDAAAVPEAHHLHSMLASFNAPPPPAPFSPELTAALLAKDKMNSFGLMEPFSEADAAERRVRAYGIYPNASFFNHDCLPNACRFDYVDRDAERNTEIVFRAIHDIPEGREVCLSYFPVNWRYKERQRRLLEDYGFSCECDRCRVEREWRDDDNDEGGDEDDVDGMEEEDGDEGMDEEDNRGDEAGEDFPHAYFFVRYLCDRDGCGGTLAPLPQSPDGTPSNVLECNVCGRLRAEEEEAGRDEDSDGAMTDN